MKLEQLIKKTDYYYVNSDLTSANFPKPKKIETKNWKMITIDKMMTIEEVLAEIKRQGCRPGNIWELAEWANNHREKVPKEKSYVALGSVWEDSYGDHWVPYVNAHSGGGFSFSLGHFEVGWRDDGCLLCFCDKSLDTGKLGKELDSLTLEKAITQVEEALTILKSLR